jgi:N-acetylmuramoyl-L-alanine amidase
MLDSRQWLIVLLLLLAAPIGAAAGKATAFASVSINGNAYLQVGDWAKANQLDLTWMRPGKTAKLANNNLSVVLTDDSKLLLVGGVGVWLSYPVVMREGKVFLSLVDLKATVVPLFSPPRHPKTVRTIALDPGHGGRDRGYYKGSLFEKNLTLLLALEVRTQLVKAGFKVVLTRTTDVQVERADRPALAQARQADLFVSLHFNSAGEAGTEPHGVETYCATPVGARSTNVQGNSGNTGPAPGNIYNGQNLVLAYLLQRSLVKSLGWEDRGVRRARWEVLCQAEMPAALIEAGFLSNPQEGNRIADPIYRRRMAKAIAEGILAYKRSVESRPAARAG